MAKLRVLIVDDYADVRLTLEAGMELHGYAVVACVVPQALVEAQRFAPDIILVEVSANAMQLIGKLREGCPSAIVIGMTNNPDGPTADELGIAMILVKPFKLEQLHAEIVQTRLS